MNEGRKDSFRYSSGKTKPTLDHTQKLTQNEWIRNWNVRPETIECTAENRHYSLWTSAQPWCFCELVSKGKGNKLEINKWDYITQKAQAQQRKHQGNKRATNRIRH